MEKIFITGLHKSGTTLLLRLFNAFKDTWVIRNEVSIEDFVALKAEQVGDYKFCVAKRQWNTIFSSTFPSEHEKEYQLLLLKEHDIKIVNIVRDGRDVVKSIWDSWGIWRPFDWMECIEQSQKHKDAISLQLCYEDILRFPNETQEEVRTILGLEKQHDWSDYPNFILDYDSFSGGYELRPLDVSIIKKDTDFYKSKRPQDIEHFDNLLKELNYVRDSRNI